MIEAVAQHNLHEVLPLIRGYMGFYQLADIDDERNRRFFSRFGEDCEEGCQFLYRDESGRAVAFATVYFSFVSSICAKVGVMNDLYTLPECRGGGIGRELVAHCRGYAASKGAARLQWLTAPDNVQAQALYDSLGARSSDWKVYTWQCEEQKQEAGPA